MCECRLEPADAVVRPIPTSEVVIRTRQFFGLPTDVPVVATGHQPSIPHPGILAKYVRVRSLADAWGAAGVHLVIDTEAGRVGDIDVPVGKPPLGLSVRTLPMLRESGGVLAFRPPAVVNIPDVPRGVGASVREGIETIAAAWRAAGGASGAEQAAAAVAAVLRPRVGELTSVHASGLLQSPIGEALLDAMRADVEGCVRCYNEAVHANPSAGVRPLEMGESMELPLWRVEEGALRPARPQDLDTHPTGLQDLDTHPTGLLPRALVTTALARVAVADHFIHGLGGWSYDRVMEQWMDRWLGWTMCPRSLATASVRLPNCSDTDVGRAMLGRERVLRRLVHDPAGRGMPALSPEKAALLGQIRSAPPGGKVRQAAFTRMHQQLAELRPLAAVGHARSQLAAARRSAMIARRRTWAFPCYPPEAISELCGAMGHCGPLQECGVVAAP